MIHGGQKYALEGAVTGHAEEIAKMPARWDACFGGFGELDLTSVKFLGDEQVMWPAGSLLSEAAVFAAAKLVNADTEKLSTGDYPAPFQGFKKFKGPVYALPEKVLETKTLIEALAKPLQGRIFKGVASEVLPDGQVAVNGRPLRAEAVIFAAGAGNEIVFSLLNVQERKTQRRPLHQVMVRPMPDPLHGHGIVAAPKPRLTVTSHPMAGGNFVWYLGGGIAEESAGKSAEEAIAFAKKEMAEIFPHINWDEKEWATWAGDRAEPYDADGRLPSGPHLHQRGKILIAWPVKLTFVPLLSDRVLEWLKNSEIAPRHKTPPPDFPPVGIGLYPWEAASWKKA
jgi:hypothetical protein